MANMANTIEHCTQCQGTGKVRQENNLNSVTCLQCAGSGIAPEQKPVHNAGRIGPFRLYPAFKRDLIILVGLIVLLLVLNGSIGTIKIF